MGKIRKGLGELPDVIYWIQVRYAVSVTDGGEQRLTKTKKKPDDVTHHYRLAIRRRQVEGQRQESAEADLPSEEYSKPWSQ